MTDRIAALEAKIASAQAELAAIKAGGKAVPPTQPPRDDRAGVRIVQLVESSNFVWPTPKELRKLYDIVLGKYPQLGPYKDITNPMGSVTADEHFDGFCSAFERLGYIGRSAAPDHKHYVSHWAFEAVEWLRLHRPGFQGNVSAGFLAAVLAHGDICFVIGDGSRGIVWSVGLASYGGTKATDKWRKVLAGEMMSPIAPERRFAPPSPARVVSGW
jgi:hypothetical protein